MFRSQDIQAFVFLTIQLCDVKMSISTRDKVQLHIYLLNHNSLSQQTLPIDRYKQGQ